MIKKLLLLIFAFIAVASAQSVRDQSMKKHLVDTTRGNHPLNRQWWTWQRFIPAHTDSALYRATSGGGAGGTTASPTNYACEDGYDSRGKITWQGSFVVPQDVQCLLYAAVPVKATLSGVPRWGVGGPPLNCYNCTWSVIKSSLSMYLYISTDQLEWTYVQHYYYEHEEPEDIEIAGWMTLPTRSGYYRSFYSLGLGAGQTVYFRVVIDSFFGATLSDAQCPYFIISEPMSEATEGTPFLLWASGCNYTVPNEWVDAARWKHDTLEVDGTLIVSKNFQVNAAIASVSNSVKTSYSAGDPADSTVGELDLWGATGHLWKLIPANTATRTNFTPDKDGMLAVLGDLPKVSGGSQIVVLKGKNNVQITQSNDTTYIEANSSATGGGSFITCPGDKPPDSAAVSSFNDEFNFSLIDTTDKWKWRNRGATTYLAAQQSFCVMRDTGTGATSNWRIIEQTITDTTWSITAKISYAAAAGAFNNVGLIAFDSTNGRLLHFGPAQDASYCYVQLNKYNSVTSYNSSGYSKTVNQNAGLTAYYRLRKDSAKNFYADFSQDGVVWSKVWSEAGSTFIESSGEVDRVGIGVNAYGSGIIAPGTFWFFRYNWTADFDPTTDN